MTWKYALIRWGVGIIVGAVAIRFGTRKLRQQPTLQYDLEKSAADYRQRYQHMVKRFHLLLPAKHHEDNPFRYRLTER